MSSRELGRVWRSYSVKMAWRLGKSPTIQTALLVGLQTPSVRMVCWEISYVTILTLVTCLITNKKSNQKRPEETTLRDHDKKTKAEKTKLLHNFALDVVDRCTAKINQSRELYAEDADKIKSKLSYTKHVMFYPLAFIIVLRRE